MIHSGQFLAGGAPGPGLAAFLMGGGGALAPGRADWLLIMPGAPADLPIPMLDAGRVGWPLPIGALDWGLAMPMLDAGLVGLGAAWLLIIGVLDGALDGALAGAAAGGRLIAGLADGALAGPGPGIGELGWCCIKSRVLRLLWLISVTTVRLGNALEWDVRVLARPHCALVRAVCTVVV